MSKNGPEAGAPANSAAADKIYEERGPKMIIRLLTVGAYMFSVSFAAVVLSGYYIFLWHPPNSRLIHAHAAHLKADSEMDFLVANSMIAIQVNKSNKFEHNDTLKEAEANNRYKYLSSPIQTVTQHNRLTKLENDVNSEAIVQGSEELTRGDEFDNNERLQLQRKSIVKKSDSNIIKFLEKNKTFLIHEQTSNEISNLMNNKNSKIQATNFSTNNIIYNNSMKPENSTLQQKLNEENFESNSKRLNYSQNTKILKRFFKIL